MKTPASYDNLQMTHYSHYLSNSTICPTHSHKNINAHIAAIKFTAEVMGFDPEITNYNRLYRVMRGIKRTKGAIFEKPPRIPNPVIETKTGRKNAISRVDPGV